MMNDDDDFKARERLHQYLKIFGSVLTLMILSIVLFIFLKQAQMMNEVTEKMQEAMQEVSDSIDHADSESYSNDYSSDY